MPELELLRDLSPPVDHPTEDSVREARMVLLRHIDRPRRERRVALLAPPVLAAALIGLAVGLIGGDGASRPSPAAAGALHEVAEVARGVAPTHPPGPGQYLYTRSVNAHWGETVPRSGEAFNTITPSRRETWIAGDGTGWVIARAGRARFMSSADRREWIAAGRPALADGDLDVALESEGGLESPTVTRRLPDDPDALYDQLERTAQEHGDRKHVQMFVLVGDALRESYASPSQRGALYEVAARIPGVVLIGRVRDGVGRLGTAVAIDDEANRVRQTLIFDPRTSALLGEEERVLSGNFAGYPAGTRTGYAAYLRSAVVDGLKERPR